MNAARPARIAASGFAANSPASLSAPVSCSASGTTRLTRPSLFGVEGASGEEQLEGAVAADNARQVHKVNGWQYAKIDLRITERGAFGGENDVARDSERHAAATRGAVDRRDRRFAELTLRVEQPDIEFVHQRPDLVWRASSKLDDIQTSAETLCHRARDYEMGRGSHSRSLPVRRDLHRRRHHRG